ARALDEVMSRADEHLARLPAVEGPRRELVSPPRSWRVGDRARSRSQGWEGRVIAMERGGKRATLESGGLRVTVPTDDLDATDGGGGTPGRSAKPPAAVQAGGIAGLRLDRAKSVASSLDLRGARVDEAVDALGRYLDDASLAGLDRVTILHGLGTGALRDAGRIDARQPP